jgi:hypothetical protein
VLKIGLGPTPEIYILEHQGSHLNESKAQPIEPGGFVAMNEAPALQRSQEPVNGAFVHTHLFGDLRQGERRPILTEAQENIEGSFDGTYRL